MNIIHIRNILEKKVNLTESCIGEEALAKSNNLSNGDVLLLENVRFYEEEEKNDCMIEILFLFVMYMLVCSTETQEY